MAESLYLLRGGREKTGWKSIDGLQADMYDALRKRAALEMMLGAVGSEAEGKGRARRMCAWSTLFVLFD